MPSEPIYLAIDLGAESGRAIAATIRDNQIHMTEVHRFEHSLCTLPTGLHWDLTHIWQNIVEGVKRGAQHAEQNNAHLASIGVDTWGVDWTLIGTSGEVLTLPHCYRDPRHEKAYERVLEQLGADRIYDATGIQMTSINTLHQLAAHHATDPEVFERAETLLFMPDLFHYWLTGQRAVEATIASTSQMVDIQRGGWATHLLDELGIPSHMLGKTVAPGTTIGKLRHELAEQAGVEPAPVIAPASHDTASAVAAVPATEGKWCYLSSGTWSLMGAEIGSAKVTREAQQAGFTHELGIGAYRFLTNIVGLWLVQECRRAWESSGESYDYAQLTRMAEEAEPMRTIVDPSHGPFMSAGDMPGKIARFAEQTGQPAPESPGQYVRCCLESLALMYRATLEGMEQVLGQTFDRMHVVGGGGRNELLNQMTADALQRPVVVGPYEASAAGNALVQAMGAGAVDGASHIRRIMAASSQPVTYEPGKAGPWNKAYERFTELRETAAAK